MSAVCNCRLLPVNRCREMKWVYPLKTKDQVFECFKEWQTEVENFTGKKVKILRTDNGGEFTSNSFQAHLKSCGVRHELTIPKTPEQNGAAERLNRTLETTRAMLLDAMLPVPQKFWAEAVSTAAYLKTPQQWMEPHPIKPGIWEETMRGALESVWKYSICPCS